MVKVFPLAVGLFIFGRVVWSVVSRHFGSTPMDELMMLFFAIYFAKGTIKINSSLTGTITFCGFTGYFLILALNGLINPIALENTGVRGYLTGLALELKWFIIVVGACHFAYSRNSRQYMDAFRRFLLITALINSVIALGDAVVGTSIIDGSYLVHRGPLALPNGLFGQHVASADVTLVGLLALIASPMKEKKLKFILTIYLSVVLLMHGSVKEILSMMVIYILLAFRYGSVGILRGTIVAIVIGAGLMATPFPSVVIDRIQNSVGQDADENVVRSLLYAGGISAMIDYAPLGTGPSSFASEGARQGYMSSLYRKYGIFGQWGASYDASQFLVDVFWPKIMAEGGIIGLIFYLIYILTPGVFLARHFRHLDRLGLFVMGIYTSALIISTASPIYNTEFYGVVYAITIAFGFNLKNITRLANEQVAKRQFDYQPRIEDGHQVPLASSSSLGQSPG